MDNTPLLRSEDDVLDVCNRIELYHDALRPTQIQALCDFISDVQWSLEKRPGQLGLFDWPQRFLQIGHWAMNELGINGLHRQSFAKLLMQKHDAYGPKPIQTWGNVGVIIRISAKLDRLENLKKNPSIEAGDEYLTDTLRDILGYAVLGYIYATKQEKRNELSQH